MKFQRGTCSIVGRFVRGGLACVLLLVLVCAEETSAEPVTERTGETVKHGDGVKENPADKMGADIPSGDGTLVKSFTPPLKKKFLPFGGITPVTHVDIQTDPALLDAVPAPDTSTLIKVTVDDVPADAPLWPLRCEGNLPGKKVTDVVSVFSWVRVVEKYFWRALVANKLIELDVREHGRQTNRIGRDDPRLTGGDALARNKLLVWHNEGAGHKITVDLVKPPDITDAFWVRIEDKSGTNPDLPIDFDMDTDSWTGTYNIAWDLNYGPDLVVKYGLDADDNEELSEDEVVGQYEVFGISGWDKAWALSRIKNWFIKFALYDLADAITWRFVDGSFRESEYNPTSSDQTYVVSAYDLAHPFGATAEADGFAEIDGRQYFKAKMTLPVYYYAPESAGAELVRGRRAFRVGINSFIAKLTWAQVDAAYKTDPDPGPTKAVEFADVQTSFKFGATGSIGLGGASSTGGNLTLNITPVGDAYRIEAGSTVAALRIEDIFDYNYFTKDWASEWSGAPLHAASVQCGFGRYDVVDGVGQVAFIRIDVSGNVSTNLRLIPKP